MEPSLDLKTSNGTYNGAMNRMLPSHRLPLRIGVLDNDRLALECIVAILRHLNNRDGRQLDIWATDQPARAIQECQFDAKATAIVIIDMALRGTTGVQVATSIREHVPHIGIIGITSYAPEVYDEALRHAGAQALLDKSTLHDTIEPAIDAVASGSAYPVDSGFAGIAQSTAILEQHRSALVHRQLTATERRIVGMSLQHADAKVIAEQLGIRVDTVFSHRRNIKNKLHTHTWHDVLDICRDQGF